MAVSGRASEDAEDGGGSTPYFFLSYARHHRSVMDKAHQAEDPDRWTLRFFDDLTFEVTELTTLARGTQPGFMDRDVHVGQQWQRRISEALAACRVFLPLYTPRYFTSLNCASEWYLFQARQSAHELTSGARPEAIIPVLWLPIPDTELPAAARALQFDHHTLGEAYARLGFLQLIRLARYKDDYQLAIHALARHVVRVARDRSPRPAFPVDFTALRGRFDNADRLFAAAGELVRRAGAGRPPLLLPGPRPQAAGAGRLALPPGTGEPAKAAGVTGSPAEQSKTGAAGSGTGEPTGVTPTDSPAHSASGRTADRAADQAARADAEAANADPKTGPAAHHGHPAASPVGESVAEAGDPGPVTGSVAGHGSASAAHTTAGPASTRPMAAPDSGGDGAPTAVREPGQAPARAAVGPAAVDPAAGSAGPTDRPGHQPDPHTPAEDAVAAYLSTARTKLAEWFTSRPAQVSSVDFDEFYFRAVHPAAKRALLRQLTPHASGPFPRPPRLRGDATDPPSGGPPHVP